MKPMLLQLTDIPRYVTTLMWRRQILVNIHNMHTLRLKLNNLESCLHNIRNNRMGIPKGINRGQGIGRTLIPYL